MAADKLIPVRMHKEDMLLPEVQAFRCGSKPHEIPLAEWIKTYAAEEITRKGKIWLYRLRTDNGLLGGYGCLATCKIETTEEDNSKQVIKAYEIPALALHEDFWRARRESLIPKRNTPARSFATFKSKPERPSWEGSVNGS